MATGVTSVMSCLDALVGRRERVAPFAELGEVNIA
jgi:hypothetical protein